MTEVEIWIEELLSFAGIKITEIVKLSSDPNNIKPEIKKANIKSITMHLQVILKQVS